MENLTTKDLDVLSCLLTAEQLAAKKARVYSNTLTDGALASEMERISSSHAERFQALSAILGGVK